MKKNRTGNYLEFVPSIKEKIKWNLDSPELVTIFVENKGFLKRLSQQWIKKPAVSQIHLEVYGSFIWKKINGKRTILEIANLAEMEFGEEIYPLYERICTYFNMLEKAGFVLMVSQSDDRRHNTLPVSPPIIH